MENNSEPSLRFILLSYNEYSRLKTIETKFEEQNKIHSLKTSGTLFRQIVFRITLN